MLNSYSEETATRLIRRRPLNSKQFSNRNHRKRNTNNSFSPLHDKQHPHFNLANFQQNQFNGSLLYLKKHQELGLILNHQNISYIAKNQEGSSFISNKQDQSLDSLDKMIIGVGSVLDLDEENNSISKDYEPNYSKLYAEYEKLTDKHRLIESSNNENSNSDENQQKTAIQREMQNLRSLKGVQEGRLNRSQNHSLLLANDQSNTSLRLLGPNVSISEIDQEQEIQENSISRMDPIEEEFIDFVSNNNENSQINISKIIDKQTNKHYATVNHKQLNSSQKELEEDEVVAMLENELGSRTENHIEEESDLVYDELVSPSNQRNNPNPKDYNQILTELDQNQDKNMTSNSFYIALNKRADWIQSRLDKTQTWKRKQLRLLLKMKQIMANPFVDASDDEDLKLHL